MSVEDRIESLDELANLRLRVEALEDDDVCACDQSDIQADQARTAVDYAMAISIIIFATGIWFK